MLGPVFTAQHSDARVLEQLLYKWATARGVVGEVIVENFRKLAETGWRPTEAEVLRDVGRLFGGAYEEFMAK